MPRALEKCTVAELKEKAAKRKIKLQSKSTKAMIIRKLRGGSAEDPVTYKEVFEQLQSKFTTFCNDQCKDNKVTIDFATKGAFIAMVGPPARGKSASYDVINTFVQETTRGAKSAILYNAGDFRRIWEQYVYNTFDNNYTGFSEYLVSKKILTSAFVDDTVISALTTWLHSDRSSTPQTAHPIPGSVFKLFGNINNIFHFFCDLTGTIPNIFKFCN